MIYRASKVLINYLLTSRVSVQREELHEPEKRKGNYILIDYFDWLEHLSKVTNTRLTYNSLLDYKMIYGECKPLIDALSGKLTSQNISSIIESNTRMWTTTSSYTRLELLLQGYKYFTEDIKDLQVFLIKSYDFNPSTIPILVIPFSFGLNKLATKHYNIKEKFKDDGLPHIDLEKGILQDNNVRSKIDLGVRTYTFFKLCEGNPYNLPREWQISNTFDTRSSTLILNKTQYVSDCFSQFCYTDFFLEQDDNETTTLEICSDFKEDKNNKVFLLNYPFLLKRTEFSNVQLLIS